MENDGMVTRCVRIDVKRVSRWKVIWTLGSGEANRRTQMATATGRHRRQEGDGGAWEEIVDSTQRGCLEGGKTLEILPKEWQRGFGASVKMKCA